MSEIWLSADTHFNHNKDFIYQPRGFSSIKEHDEAIIENWNRVVKQDDIVYLLGDVFLGQDPEYGIKCLKTLNGQITIIRGNHDTDSRCAFMRANDYHVLLAEMLKYKKYVFFLCHYPTLVHNLDFQTWMWNLHGHTHSKEKFEIESNTFNAGLDANGLKPVNLDYIVLQIRSRKNEISTPVG